jgi:hypothetical protein
LAASSSELLADLRVSTNFESGSASVVAIDTNTQTIRFQPAGKAERGWQNWWFLRVDGADTRRPVNLELEAVGKLSPAWAMPDRAAFSTNGSVWTQTALGERRDKIQIYRVSTPSPTFWLAWGPPFTASDAAAFGQRLAAAHSSVKTFELCKSLEGRSVPAWKIAEGARPSGKRMGVWIVAREHAWESGGSWVARGIVEWLVGPDEHARWLRENAEVFVVPVMDVDRVATGDGGKGSSPRDHTFDWSEPPHYREVAAAQQQIRSLLQEGRMNLLLDLHNPGARKDPEAEGLYLTPPNLLSAPVVKLQERFVSLLQEEFPKLTFTDEKPRSNDPVDVKRWHGITTSWLLDQGSTNTVGYTIETPWNTPQGTTEGYAKVGRRLGLVMEKYLRGLGQN